MRFFVKYAIAGILLIAAWKLIAASLSSAILPPPEAALSAFGQAIKTRPFWEHFAVSAYRVAGAMAVAFALAFPGGILLGFHRRADAVLSPFVFLTYPIPKIVFLPIFLLLFGLGDVSKILMIALIIGYQILVTTRDGVLGLDKKYIDSFRSLGGTPADILRHVVIPAALPQAFTALRIGTGTGIAVLFFVESFATSKGLGFLIMDAWGRFDYRMMFVGIIGMSLLGILLYEIFNYLEKNICAWKYLTAGLRTAPSQPPAVMAHIQVFGRMIKFSHTVFALPFALAAVVLAHRNYPLSAELVFWILVAMIGARSAAMGFNRIVDARYDSQNPRTARRAIPTGAISVRSAAIFVIVFSALFVMAAAMISRLCFWLSFPVLLILFAYSYTKRFTAFSHFYLGFSISLAPVGAWLAVTGGFEMPVLLLSMGLLTYIAGFDILYACQDVEFDQRAGLFSIPARWGPKVAFHTASLLHVCSFLCFFSILVLFDLGLIYLVALIFIGALFIVEHQLVRPHDLTHIQTAFFHVNSAISVILFLGILGDEIMRKWL